MFENIFMHFLLFSITKDAKKLGGRWLATRALKALQRQHSQS